MFQIIVFMLPIIMAFLSPMSAIAILSHIYVLRIAVDTNIIECIGENCSADSDPLFGAALPLIVFTIIIIKTFVNNKGVIQYSFDFADKVFLLLISVMLIGCIYTPDLEKSIEYLLKFIALGASFFYVSKLVVYNTDYNKEIQNFIKTIYILSISMAALGIYYYYSRGVVVRMSLPGAHPIPYSLLIGQGFLISLALFFTKGKIIGTSSHLVTTFNLFMIFFLLFCQFLTNTRGVTVAMVLASTMMILFNFKKIGFLKVMTSIPLGFIVFIYILGNMDTNALFARFNNISNDQSVNLRTLTYSEVWEVIGEHTFFGIGTDAFSFYTTLGYPHNFFLELWGSFGVFGLVIGILFLIIIIQYTLSLFTQSGSDVKYQLMHAFMIFFFIEIMFSFSLWMHRGFYLSLAVVTVIARLLMLEKITPSEKSDITEHNKI